MKTTVQGKEVDVVLRTKFNEYNCSTKMVGRPYLVDKLLNIPRFEDIYDTKLRDFLLDNKHAIIEEWVKSLEDRTLYATLRTGNNMFPFDGGQYLPSVLLFSDQVLYKGDVYWNDFREVVRELQRDASYGVKVIALPCFNNRTYKTVHQITPRYSRVWALFPPSVVDGLYVPDNPKLDSKFKKKELASVIPNQDDRDEVLKAIAT